MSHNLDCLHSHSALERDLHFPKDIVLVDEKFQHMFLADYIKPFVYNGVRYYKVPTLSFVKKGGIFKNLTM